MAVSLPVTIPSTPSSGSSPSSEAPRTPISPNMSTPQLPESSNTGNSTAPANATTTSAPANQMKRKPSRRANTAERRATHNAVERQRRETLNGRFLDLAALLPNLSQIRRPSKSSIVNSSIAHVHASRRHRLLASRELRLLKQESDALRRELNEWRDRANLPRVEEPMRGDGFSMVISAELETITSVQGEEEDDEDNQGFGGYGGEEDDFGGAMDGISVPNSNPFAHNIPPSTGTIRLSHVPSHTASHGPMIASNPPTVNFENPAMAALYEPHPHQNSQYGNTQFIHHQPPQTDNEKWNAHVFPSLNGSQQMFQAQRSLYTPPSSAHGLPTAPPSSHGNPPQNAFSDAGFFANLQRQQQFNMMHQQIGGQSGAMYDHDDTSSVGSSGRGGRARSSSVSNSGSVYGSPPHVPNPGSYEMPSPLSQLGAGEFGMMRSNGSHWPSNEVELGGMGMMKQNMNGSVPNGAGFSIMV